MGISNCFLWLVALCICSVVARKGSHDNQQLFKRLENLENWQRLSGARMTRLEAELNSQTGFIKEQNKTIRNLEDALHKVTSTVEHARRISRRNRRHLSLIRGFLRNKGFHDGAEVPTHRTESSKTPNTGKTITSNNREHSHHQNQKADKINTHKTSHHQNQKTNKTNTHHHSHQLNHKHTTEKSNTIEHSETHTQTSHHENQKTNKTNTHHHSHQQNHKHTTEKSNANGHSETQKTNFTNKNERSHSQKHNHNHHHDKTKTSNQHEHSHHKNQNADKTNTNHHSHQQNYNTNKGRHYSTMSPNVHVNLGHVGHRNGHFSTGQHSHTNKHNQSKFQHNGQRGHDNVPIKSESQNRLPTTGSEHQHKHNRNVSDDNQHAKYGHKHSNDINGKETDGPSQHHKHQKENQGTRHESQSGRRSLNTPRQAFGGIAFSVYLDHDATVAQHETVKFNKVITNDGNGYDAQTGVFTCAEGGVYMLTFSIGQRDQDHYMWAELMVNSKNMIDAVVDTYHPAQDLQGGNTVIVRLKQGDRVWIDATHNGSHVEGSGALRLTTFSGLYLYA